MNAHSSASPALGSVVREAPCALGSLAALTHPANAFGMLACSGRMTPHPSDAAKAAA